jgi:hypothetical protein
MASIILDALIYGIPTAISLGAIGLVGYRLTGRYNGKRAPQPDDSTSNKPKDEENK